MIFKFCTGYLIKKKVKARTYIIVLLMILDFEIDKEELWRVLTLRLTTRHFLEVMWLE